MFLKYIRVRNGQQEGQFKTEAKFLFHSQQCIKVMPFVIQTIPYKFKLSSEFSKIFLLLETYMRCLEAKRGLLCILKPASH